MPNEKKQSCATAYKTMIGGQALIEGIMMLGPEKKAVVVRKPDGELEEQVEERVLIKDKHPALGLPLLRGVFNCCPPPSPDWWAWPFPCPCGCATCWRAWCVSSSSWAI